MTLITDPVKRQVLALEAREKALSRRLKWFSASGAGVALAAGGAYLLARFQGPDATPSRIDVPAQLMELFSSNASSGQPFDTATAHISSLLSGLQPVVSGFVLVFILLIGIRAIVQQSLSGIFLAAPAGVALVGALYVTEVVLEPSSGDGSDTPRSTFARAVEDHRYDAVADRLRAVSQGSTPAGLYVLAQVSIAEGKNRMLPDETLVRDLLSPTAGFTPKGEALYAIEHAAYGTPRSPAGVAYLEHHLARKWWTTVTALVLGGLTVLVGGAALGHLGLRLAIGRRMQRIRTLLGQNATA